MRKLKIVQLKEKRLKTNIKQCFEQFTQAKYLCV